AGTRTRIRDTRKTTPGLRALEKYAVKTGGGSNHRFGLYDAILLKENHIALAGGMKEALDKAHTHTSPKVPPPRAASAYDAAGLDPEVVGPGPLAVQIEVRDQKELVEALRAGAEAVLLTLLAENATMVTSGTRIAKEVGVSRSMVWQWVERLRELGVKVKSQPGTGYFLEQIPDILTPDMLKHRLKGSLFGKRIFHFFRTDSTNRVALELGHAGEP